MLHMPAMKKLCVVSLFRFGGLFVALAASGVPCGAALPLIEYERVLYLQQPPSYADATTLTQGRDGKLYGTVRSRINNGGVLFRVEPDGTGYAVIYSSSTNHPGGVIEGSDGRLYGTMSGPVTNAPGVFRMDRDGGDFVMLRTVASDRPQFGVIQDGVGWLYGTTTGDGLQDGGSVFRMNTNGTGFQVLHQFGGLAEDDGFIPGALALGRDGLLYGCTFFGGYPSNAGTVFKIARDGSDYSVLHRFGERRELGGSPMAEHPLLEGSDGFLYGAADGGSNRAGVIFKLNKAGGHFQVLHHFAGERGTGDSPLGGLVEWCDGALYGATYEGGIDGAGTLFRINKDGSGFAVVRIYIDTPNPGATEGTPKTSLLSAADGRLYGITSGGTVAEGTVYRIRPLPALQIQIRPGAVVVSWLSCWNDYSLEESNEAGASDEWRRIENVGHGVGGVQEALLPRSSEQRFFRLVRP